MTRPPAQRLRLLRQFYLDEAGTSQNDTHAVVAGPAVHADDELLPIQKRLADIVEEFIPEPDRRGFVFHMTDIWNNGKYFKNKDAWPWERRKPIVDALVGIPKLFELPIVFQFVRRAEIEATYPSFSVGAVDLAVTAIAFSACEMIAEDLMRRAFPDEVAQIIAEDNEHTRKVIRESHNRYRDASNWTKDSEIQHDLLPFRHIQNGVLFAAKSESPALQVADMCAFFCRAHLRGQPHSEVYYQRLKPWMAAIPKGEPEYVASLKPAYPFGPLKESYGEE